MLTAWKVVEGEVVRASISSVYTLEDFLQFLLPQKLSKIACWDIPNPYETAEIWQKEKEIYRCISV